jgi:uncharacterized protein YcnI
MVPTVSATMRSSSTLGLTLLLLCTSLVVLPLCHGHVEFAFDTDAAGDDGFLTWLKVPHGCILVGPDNGDAPERDTEAATNAIQITVPAIVPTAVAGVLPGWNITQTLVLDPLYQNNITTFTYTATPGNALVTWQALAIPFIFSTPDVAVDTVLAMPTVQYCVGGYVVYWNASWDRLGGQPQPAHPSPTLVILGSSDPVTADNSSTTMYETTSSSSTDHRLAIAAIVLSSVAIASVLCLALSLAMLAPARSARRTDADKDVQLSAPYRV